MEDAEIIALLEQRRESALDEIIHRYGRMLKSLAGRILPTAQDASFHTWFLPWFFYIEGDGRVTCQSEYTGELHTQIYPTDAEDEYMFILSDDLGNDYSVFPYEDEDTNGYWFTKPDTVGTQLTLKIVRSQLTSDSFGQITDDSYEVLCEIPIELKTPL